MSDKDVSQLYEILTRLESKMDSRFNSVDSRFNNLDARLSNMENRLSGIENTVRRIERCLPTPIDNLDISDSLPPRQPAKRKQQTA